MTDAIRTLHPDQPMYTFWDYKFGRWGRDHGLRLDHLLLSPSVAARLEDAGVDRAVRGEEGASDHAPAWMVLGERSRRRRAKKPAEFDPTRPGIRPLVRGSEDSCRT